MNNVHRPPVAGKVERVGSDDEVAEAALAAPTAAQRLASGLVLWLCVLALTLALSSWAPWSRSAPPRLSAFEPVLAVPAAALGVEAGATSTVTADTAPAAVGSPPPASTAAPATPNGAFLRPAGVPVKRTDWVIIRDYLQHGGSSATGAIDIGFENDKEAVGTPVFATHDGVVHILRNNRRYGNLVAIKNDRWSTTYAHLDSISVAEGQTVRRGVQIGAIGATGQAERPQLDYQVWETVDGREHNRNPMDFLSSEGATGGR